MSERIFESNAQRKLALVLAFPIGVLIGSTAGAMIDSGVSPPECVTLNLDITSTSGEVFQGPYKVCNDTSEDGRFKGLLIGGLGVTALAFSAAAADAVLVTRDRRRSTDQQPAN